MENSQKMKQEMLQKLKAFCLFDDDFMSKVFEDNYECIELILHIIMDKPDLKVQIAQIQYSIKNLEGRSVRLDIHAIDTIGKKYNIEVQREDKGASPKRARYNSSVIDTKSLPAGAEFEELPETYVIFITKNDVIGYNKPLYHIDRVIKETGELFGDEEHIVYVNGAYQDESPLGKLMHDFSCSNPEDMYYKLLADRTRYFKEDEKGVAEMCELMEDLVDSGKKDDREEKALRMLNSGRISIEEIAEFTKMTVDEVKMLEENEKLVTP